MTSFTITINPNPIVAPIDPDPVCTGTTVDLTAIAYEVETEFYGGTPMYYMQDGTTAVTDPSAVGAGTYVIKVVSTAGCPGMGTVVVTEEACGGPLCTYTQGAYGNAGGKYCDGTEGGIATVDLIEQSLANAGGTITVGMPGRSVTMSSGDTACIIAQMPGGGPAKELPASDVNMCPKLPNTYLKNGRIGNVLLSQTIALALNINITSSADLGSQELQAKTMATAKPEGGCGSDIAKERVCGHYEGEIWIPTVNEYTYRTFSQAVITALNGDETVNGLLHLANRALADDDMTNNTEGGVSLSEIAGAVAAVNEIFDECAIFKGWVEDIPQLEPCMAQPEPLTTSTFSTAKTTEIAGFNAYPVPVEDQLSVQCTFDYTSDVLVEVFDSSYQLKCAKSVSKCTNGMVIVLDNCGFVKEQQQVYYVRVTTDRGSSTRTIMSAAK